MAHQLSGLGLIGFLDLRIWNIAKQSYHPSILQIQLILILTIILF